MITVAWVAILATFVLVATARTFRLQRLLRDRDGLVADLRAQLARADGAADRLRRRARYLGLQNAIERRRTRKAEKDAAEWKGIACHQLERLVTVQERQQLQAAVETVEDGLREIGAGS